MILSRRHRARRWPSLRVQSAIGVALFASCPTLIAQIFPAELRAWAGVAQVLAWVMSVLAVAQLERVERRAARSAPRHRRE